MTAAPSTEQVLRVPEVRERLGVRSDDSVYQLIRRGELRAIRIGRLIRVPESALRDFLAGGDDAE